MRNYTEQYSVLWKMCSTQLPDFPKTFDNSAKKQREHALDHFLKTIRSFRNDRIRRKPFFENEEDLFFRNIREFLKKGLDFTENQLEMMFSDDLIEVTRTFVRETRAFDPDLSFAEIFQACRNVWIMNGLQLIMGIQIKLTPSIFAYSLLYPYTDNMIDDPLISGFDKMTFSNRFRARLSGLDLEPSNKTEISVFQLVKMIENQYSRLEFPEVYESLLAIHDAQTQSVNLIHLKNSISENEILKICLAKGGTSVLADGYLVAGKLTDAQHYFLYGYGAYLQLLDDVQDVEEDQNAGLMTVFSKEFRSIPLDEKLNKTYWFGEQVMKSLEFFDGQHIDLFKSLMRKSMDLFITEAIAQNPDAYSEKYAADFESWSPFHFSYIRKRKEHFMPYNGILLTAIEEIAFVENLRTPDPKILLKK